MRDLEADIVCALRGDLNVMISGEDGVGKTSVAHRIHRESRRAPGPLVVARSPEVLDAVHNFDRALLEAAPNGTVLLENPERMSLPVQSRLLQFIEPRTIRDGAGRRFVHSNRVRFITVTSQNLFELVERHLLCESLFYRLNVIHLIIPSLRDRPEDITVLLRHFLSLSPRARVPRLSTEAWQRLVTYAWPGNLRELRAVAETLASRELPRLLGPDDLPPDIRH